MPLSLLCGYLNTKFNLLASHDDEDSKQNSDILLADAICHFKTVASLGHDDSIVKKYNHYEEVVSKGALRKIYSTAVIFGLAGFLFNAIYAFLFFMGAEFNYHSSTNQGVNIFVTIFSMMFAAYTAGNFYSSGPDLI